MRIHAVVCAAVLLLLLGSTGVCAQSMKTGPYPPPTPDLAADASVTIRTSLHDAVRPGAVVSTGRVRYRAAVMQLLHRTADQAHEAPAPTQDPVYEILFRPATAPGDFFSEFVDLSLVNEARSLLHRATTYRDERFTLQVDPFKPRCTLQIPLGRRTRTTAQEP